jgi:hypothetical protein
VVDEQDAGAKHAPKRGEAGRFKPGHSGNPRGKAKGVRNQRTLLLEGIVEKSGPKVVRKILKLALDGDVTMLKWLGDRLLPVRRERPVEFDLPKIETAEDALLCSRLILAGTAAGVLTPTEAAAMAKVLQLHAQLYELTDLEKLLGKLERERGLGSGSAIQ